LGWYNISESHRWREPVNVALNFFIQKSVLLNRVIQKYALMISSAKDRIPETGILDSCRREMTAQTMLALRANNAPHSVICAQNKSLRQLSGSGLPASPAIRSQTNAVTQNPI